jgi:hypothetical protein
MWSGPRNISTAMMRAFGNRPDTAVIDEPFYAAYLSETGLDHPLRAEILASQPTDWRQVVLAVTGPAPRDRAVFYQKHMTHHMLPQFGRDWMATTRPAFLIRDPADVLASYSATRENPTLDDIGIRQQAALFDAACDQLGHAPPVVDATDVLADPEWALGALCVALGIDFLPAMLHWPAGARETDGAWAPAWYQSVNASTGFQAPGTRRKLPPDLAPLAAQARPYYEHLGKHRLLPKTRGAAPRTHLAQGPGPR